jgi:hypothetical protein
MTNKTSKNSKEGKGLIELMIRNEELFAKLYQKYSLLYEDVRDFWLHLAEEERRHAEWLEVLLKSRDVFSVRLDLLPHESVRLIGDDIQVEIDSKIFLPLKESLVNSLRFERSFFEKNYFDFITIESASVRRVIEDLKRETAEHIRSVEKELEKIGA